MEKRLVWLLFLFLSINLIEAATIYSRNNGIWSDVGNNATWSTSSHTTGSSCNCKPTSVDDVRISVGHTVTLDETTTINSLTITGPTSGGGTSTLQIGAFTLTVSGAITLTGTVNSGNNIAKIVFTSGTGIIDANGLINIELSGASGNAVIDMSNGANYTSTIRLSANLTNDNTITPGTGSTFEFDGTTTIGGTVEPTFKHVTIAASSTLTGRASGNFNVQGTWTNNNTYTHNSGTVTFNGTADQSLAGTASTTFYDLTCNNTDATTDKGITLSAAITVENNLTMTDGSINMNGNNIDLSTAGTVVSETNLNRIYGSTGLLRATTRGLTLNSTLYSDIGGLGINVTTQASGNVPGNTDIERGHAAQSGNGNTGITRYYIISPTTNTSLGATLRLPYLDAEITGHTEANLIFFKSTDGGSTWTDAGGTVTTASNYVEATSVASFSRWTMSDNVSLPLPIKLLYFSAEHKVQSVELRWATAAEINNDFFTIERTCDNTIFNVITTVEGAGNSNRTISYTATDENPLDGTSYYRLKQTDFDGTFTYSPLVAVNYGTSKFNLVSVKPNPSYNNTIISFNANTNDVVSVKLYNNEGQQVFVQETLTKDGINQFILDVSEFNKGMYFLHLENSNQQIINSKIVKTNSFY